jgi:hypothetical protein
MYRKRTRGSKKFNEAMARARAAKERLRLDGPAPEYPPDLPLIRRRVIIEDYDCGQVVRHEFTLARSGRIDSYDVSADGVSLGRMGWARVLVFVRKAFIRVGRFD